VPKTVDQVLLRHQRLTDYELADRRLRQLVVEGCEFRQSTFRSLSVDSASLGAGKAPSEYVDCIFDRCRFTLGPGGYARFERCSFRDVDLKDWFCFAVELVDCVFAGHLRTAVFNGSVPVDKRSVAGRSTNAFIGNNFIHLELIDVAFRTGIDLNKQLLPSGPDYLMLYDAPRAVGAARTECLDRGGDAAILLDAIERELAGGQRQLLLRATNYRGFDRSAVTCVFDALRNSRDSP